MSQVVKKTFTVTIEVDDNPDSPEDWDNLGTMWTLERNSRSRDKHKYGSAREIMEAIYGESVPLHFQSDVAEMSDEKLSKAIDRYAIVLNVYKFEHSGVAYSTKPFGDPWDSGQVGVIWISKQKVREEYKVTRVAKDTYEKVVKVLESEVKVWSQYASGDVYGYIIEDEDGDELDSCWGCYGLDYTTEQAAEAVKQHLS